MLFGPHAWIVCSECRRLYDGRAPHACTGLPVLSARQIEIGLAIAARHGLLVPSTGVEPA